MLKDLVVNEFPKNSISKSISRHVNKLRKKKDERRHLPCSISYARKTALEQYMKKAQSKNINVGNIHINIEFDCVIGYVWRKYRRKADQQEFRNEYNIEINVDFGKGTIASDHYSVQANDIEDVVQYFRNEYQGMDFKENHSLIRIVPYSWE